MDADNRTRNEESEVYGPFEAVGPVDVETALAEMRSTLARQQEEIERLRKQVKLARGTSDVKDKAAEALAATKALTPGQAVEAQLRANIMTTDDLSKATGYTREEVLGIIKANRPKIHNLGTPDRGRWSWRIGSDAPPQELRALVERLITFAPMEFRELVTATGAREGLIQGHLVELRRAKPVVDLGTPGRARWFLMPARARDASLVHHRTKRKPE